MDPTQLSAAEAGRAIAGGSLSPVALTEAYLDRIAALDGELHSYVLVLRDEALDAAREAEREIRDGRARGPLHGIPIGLKDIYKTKGVRTTAGSRVYLDHVPDEDAESWVRLREAGTILLGKQETHEFAIGGPDFTLPFPPARNPWNTAHYPAGSSSGTAAAVGAHLCAAGDGVGHRRVDPRPGRLLRSDRAEADLWQGQPARRLSAVLHARPLRAADPHGRGLRADAAGAGRPTIRSTRPRPMCRCPITAPRSPPRLDGMTIGVIRHWHERDAVAGFGPESAPSPTYVETFDTACRTLESLGARLVDIRVSPLLDFADANRVIMMAEAYALHESDFRERPATVRPPHVRADRSRRVPRRRPITSRRCAQRRELCREMAEALAGVDAIVSRPTRPARRRASTRSGPTPPSTARRIRRLTTSPDCRRCRCRSGSRTDCRWPSRSPASRSTRPRCCAPATPSSRQATSA